MKYISTRSSPEKASFSDVILSSTSADGGLYVPEYYPDVSDRLAALAELSYTELAFEIIRLFTDDEIDDEDLKVIIDESYAGFSDPDVVRSVEFADCWLMELFHGPTLAFKDFALQLLGGLFEYLLEKRDASINLIGATSGDTGSAAIHSVKSKNGINLFMIHPYQGISLIQKLQMTSVRDSNIFNVAITGNFDDGQRMIKEIFSDRTFCQKYAIGSVNSINWGRIVGQVVYYFYAGLRFHQRYPGKNMVFAVPTGNFGNIFSGYVAYRMGLPIHQMVCATNANNIVHKALNDGVYQTGTVKKTLSPSMDIQVSSNFERLIFEVSQRNSDLTETLFNQLKHTGHFEIPTECRETLRTLFLSDYADDNDTLNLIQRMYEKYGYICDPHTAIGIHCARKVTNEMFIALATAHYAKFMTVFERFPEMQLELPESIQELMRTDAYYKKISPNTDEFKRFIVHSLEN